MHNDLHTWLDELSSAQLVRPHEEGAYSFKHALTQQAAYESLLLKARHDIHREVAYAYEQLDSEHLDENAALLAHHFELAGDWERALAYLQRAAEWAHRAAAHREEGELLTRAIGIAEQTGRTDLLPGLYLQRGKALASVGLWNEAKRELESALSLLAPEQIARRAEVLVELANAFQWSWNVAESIQIGKDALALAERAGRDDLAASAMSALALAEASDGRTRASLRDYDLAFSRVTDLRTPSLVQGLEFSGLILYWLGEHESAVTRLTDAVRRGHEIYDTVSIMRGLSELGMALAGTARYGEAIAAFEQARRFGKEHGLGAFWARALAMYGGLYLQLFDYGRAEELAEEARRVGRSANFPPAIVSAGIDLLLNYARTGHVSRAESLVREVAEALPRTFGSHRWLWGLRFPEARAELAVTQERWEEAVEAAEDAITRSRQTERVKYEALGLGTRARALMGLGRKREAIDDLNAALDLARLTSDPAMFLPLAMVLLRIDGNDALAIEARANSRRIANALPEGETRARFLAIASEMA